MLHYFNPQLQPLRTIDLRLRPRAVIQVRDSLITAVNSDGALLIFDAINSTTILKHQLEQASYSPPLLSGEKYVLIGTADGTLSKLDRQSGASLWRYEGQELLKLPLVDLQKMVLIPYTIGKLVLIDKNSGKVLWQHQLPHKIRFAIPLPNGFLIASGRNIIHWYGVNP